MAFYCFVGAGCEYKIVGRKYSKGLSREGPLKA